MAKIERKYLAHYIDTNFGEGAATYTRIGKYLEEFNEELSPDIEVTKNILGEQSANHKGYEVTATVDNNYADETDPLFEQLAKIANGRLTGDDCKTTYLDVLIGSDGAVKWAYREDVRIIPTTIGGDTAGVQIPYTIYFDGNRTKGTFDLQSKAFTPDGT